MFFAFIICYHSLVCAVTCL